MDREHARVGREAIERANENAGYAIYVNGEELRWLQTALGGRGVVHDPAPAPTLDELASTGASSDRGLTPPE
jgi:hypothetical protein